MYRIFAICVSMVIAHTAQLGAQEPFPNLSLRMPPSSYDKTGDYEEGYQPKNPPYYASITNAEADPKLPSFLNSLRGRNLIAIRIEHMTFTAEQARQIERLETDRLTISKCEMSDEVAKSLGSIECQSLTLEQIRISVPAMKELLTGKKQVSEVLVTDCDFDDQALSYLSNFRLRTLKLTNAQLTGTTLESLKTQSDCLGHLSLSGCPVNDQTLRTLPALPRLHELNLSRTLVTDEGFRNFVVTPKLDLINVGGTKVTQAWGLELSLQHQDDERALIVSYHEDPRWPPFGGYCMRGEFHLYRY